MAKSNCGGFETQNAAAPFSLSNWNRISNLVSALLLHHPIRFGNSDSKNFLWTKIPLIPPGEEFIYCEKNVKAQ